MIAPSGEQFEIRHGSLRATVVEVGGGLRTLAVGELEILDDFPESEMCHDARGQILMPWPNRLAGGKYTFPRGTSAGGSPQQLPINETSHDTAIHGLVRWTNWTAQSHAAGAVTMTHRLYPSPGYPFTLDVSAAYALGDDGLQVNLRATNAGREACPFGAGQHPYLRVGTPLVNEATLQVPARTIHRYNDQLIPVERIPVEDSPLDFRAPRPIGDTEINMDYTDLERGDDGRARVVLAAPGGSPSIEVWMDVAFRHVTVYTGETVQPPSRRRHGLAVEPMTCPPNAFVSGDDLIVLHPGETWSGSWGLTIRP